MLRMNNTNDELEYFFGRTDKEFRMLEGVIKNTLDKINAYERQIEETK